VSKVSGGAKKVLLVLSQYDAMVDRAGRNVENLTINVASSLQVRWEHVWELLLLVLWLAALALRLLLRLQLLTSQQKAATYCLAQQAGGKSGGRGCKSAWHELATQLLIICAAAY
jgi:hypothetical protein